MSDASLNCPKCGKPLATEGLASGAKVVCEQCKEEVTVPEKKPVEDKDKPASAEAASDAADRKPADQPQAGPATKPEEPSAPEGKKEAPAGAEKAGEAAAAAAAKKPVAPRPKRPVGAARAGAAAAQEKPKPRKVDTVKLKLAAWAACLLLFLACLGVGGYAVWKKFVKPPPLPPGPSETTIDYGKLIKETFDEAKALAQSAKQADQAGKYELALEQHQKAVKMFESNVKLIEDLRATPEYSGKEYEGWDYRKSQMFMYIHDSNTAIFRLDNILIREKIKKEAGAAPPSTVQSAPQPPAPPSKTTPEYDPEYATEDTTQPAKKPEPPAPPPEPTPPPEPKPKAAEEE